MIGALLIGLARGAKSVTLERITDTIGPLVNPTRGVNSVTPRPFTDSVVNMVASEPMGP